MLGSGKSELGRLPLPPCQLPYRDEGMGSMATAPDTIVLIHGLWMTPLAWEHWVTRYEDRGFRVLTPGYPGIGQGEEGLLALREDSSALASVGVREVMDHLTGIVEDLDTPPIIMGHSFGGTFAQLLVGNGLGAAGVSIDGAAVKGINAMPLSEIRSVLPALKDPANLHRAVPLTPRQFHYAFTNTLSEEASQTAYDRYAAPPPPGSCSRAASRRSPRTPPPPSTSPTTTTGHRCCSSPAAATTSCPRSSSGTTTKRTPSTPPRSPRMPSSRGATTSPAASPAGRRSPTSPSTGRSPRYPGSSSRDRAFSLTSHQ